METLSKQGYARRLQQSRTSGAALADARTCLALNERYCHAGGKYMVAREPCQINLPLRLMAKSAAPDPLPFGIIARPRIEVIVEPGEFGRERGRVAKTVGRGALPSQPVRRAPYSRALHLVEHRN